ncbi:hypothetical protein POVCU2_0010600 [Plasmodium ovale curtisi]|uniref:Uncharacterized protein n=1 Tax=Plasmodium ovale curtisi TaxID=864141 RepID=A0A1A8VME9_PLAOA|nr:hypothetical protein POVCU2_0010600 [Plasmodium ovale curtisi]SBS84008.1 hypothetical protein POVCU1_009780 [Plasmodium ovale curtisi]
MLKAYNICDQTRQKNYRGWNRNHWPFGKSETGEVYEVVPICNKVTAPISVKGSVEGHVYNGTKNNALLKRRAEEGRKKRAGEDEVQSTHPA